MVRAFAIALLGIVCLAAGPLAAQNLVVNPHFHTGDFGWVVITPPALAIAWNGSFDSNGETCSGVLAATLTTSEPLSTLAGQCITGVSELTDYDFGIDILVPLGEPADGFSSMRVDWYSDLACTDYLTSSGPGGAIPPPNDAWVTMALSAVTPPVGANSAAVLLIMGRIVGGGDAYSAIFDDAYFAPTGTYENLIFADGVESGDTSCWDVTVP